MLLSLVVWSIIFIGFVPVFILLNYTNLSIIERFYVGYIGYVAFVCVYCEYLVVTICLFKRY